MLEVGPELTVLRDVIFGVPVDVDHDGAILVLAWQLVHGAVV